MNTKILHLRSSGGLYGAEQVILNLARELSAMGYPNHILCFNNTSNPHLELMEEAKKIRLSASAVDCRGPLDVQTVKSIRDLTRLKKIDVIHCHDYKSCVYGLAAAQRQTVKLLATNHLWTRAHLKLRAYQVIEGLLYNCFDRVVAVSESIEKECRPFIFNKSKLSHIPNGIDLHRFPLDNREEERKSTRRQLGFVESDLVIGNIARLSVEKDQAVLLHAFKRLAELSKNRSIKLLIAGDGPEADNLMKLAQELRIYDQCLFAGFRQDIPQILSCLDVYVQSSRREGLPMIVLEAMASRTAVVSTKAGGVPAVITDREHGRLVEIGDADQLAHVLKDVLNSADERARLGQQARRMVEMHFSAHAMAKQYLEVYRGMTEDN